MLKFIFTSPTAIPPILVLIGFFCFLVRYFVIRYKNKRSPQKYGDEKVFAAKKLARSVGIAAAVMFILLFLMWWVLSLIVENM